MTKPETEKLPELPEPGVNTSAYCYTAGDMRAYALAAIRAQADGDGDGVEFFVAPENIHPATLNLVARFATALAGKLAQAEQKHEYSDEWASPEWLDECRAKLMEHIAKGDPRDVAAYCAFLWHHGASTTPAPASEAGLVQQAITRLRSMGEWDGKTYDEELTAILRKIAQAHSAGGANA